MRLGRVDIGQRSETVRRANLSAIVRGLHERGPLSRSELVHLTGLTRSAIRALVGELVVAGIVIQEPAVRMGTPGRPSPIARANPRRPVVLGIEIMVDSIAAVIMGLGGVILAEERVERPRGDLSADRVVADIAALVRSLLSGVDAAPIGIGVAVVGIVRRSDGLVWAAPNLGWVDVPLGELLDSALGLDVPISIANDADMGLLAEHRRGAAVGVDHVLYVSGEVGVGGAILMAGHLLTGVAGYGGEIGHMPLNPAGIACQCGSTGCWETEVGEAALLTLAGLPSDAGRAGVEAVLRDARAGMPAAVDALEEVGTWLGVGLACLVNVLNPQLVVLGAMHASIYPAVQAAIERQLDRRALRAPRATVRVIPAAIGVGAPAIGAAELALEPFLADPAAFFGAAQLQPQLASA